MQLRAYLDDQRISADEFAKQIGVDPVSVHRYLRGVRRPKWSVMGRIMSVTDGKVTPNDFVSASKTKRRRRLTQDSMAA
jgi:transcriptional regulator with XRE-family HTH domain